MMTTRDGMLLLVLSVSTLAVGCPANHDVSWESAVPAGDAIPAISQEKARALTEAHIQQPGGGFIEVEPGRFRSVSTQRNIAVELERRGSVVVRGRHGAINLQMPQLNGRDLVRGHIKHENRRIRYRSEASEEWFVSGALGVEHGFTLRAAPAGAIVLTFGVRHRGYEARQTDDELLFVKDNVKDISLSSLFVNDSANRALSASMRYRRLAEEHGEVQINIDASHAIYPITVDPLWSAAESLLPSDIGPGDGFGASVAISAAGDIIAVGAPNDDTVGEGMGTVRLFVLRDGYWQQSAVLEHDYADRDDQFGHTVAFSASGTRLLVSALRADGAKRGSGAVFWYEREGDQWVQRQRLVAEGADYTQGTIFGEALALSHDGSRALVGSPSNGSTQNGSDWGIVFDWGDDAWVQTEVLNPYGSRSSRAVALSDDGAIAYLSNGAPGVSAFSLAGGTAQPLGEIGGAPLPSGGVSRIKLSTSAGGTTLVVGVPLKSGSTAGEVHIYSRAGGSFSLQATLAPDDLQDGDFFGEGVAISPDATRVVVSAIRYDVDDEDAGAVFIYEKIDNTWTLTDQISALSPGAKFLGISVAMATNEDRIVATQGTNVGYPFVIIDEATDECETESIDCGPGASCIDTPSGYFCECDVVDAGDGCVPAAATDAGSVDAGAMDPADAGVPVDGGGEGDGGENGSAAPEYWLPSATLVNETPLRAGRLGMGVDMSSAGGVVLASGNTEYNQTGAAYVFTQGLDGVWGGDVSLDPPAAIPEMRFGRDFALDAEGTRAVVTSRDTEPDVSPSVEVVHVFDRVGTSWNHVAKIQGDSMDPPRTLGLAAKINGAGDTIVTVPTDPERMWPFNPTGTDLLTEETGLWALDTALVIDDPNPTPFTSQFVSSEVAISRDGTAVVVGGPYADHSNLTDAGAAYIFVNEQSQWVMKKLTSPTPKFEGGFGLRVAISDDGGTVVVTERVHVHIFEREQGAPVSYAHAGGFGQPSNSLYGTLGRSIAVSGDGQTVAAGEEDSYIAPESRAGRVHLYRRRSAGWTALPALMAEVPQRDANFGAGVAVNNDGTVIAVGAPGTDAPLATGGAAAAGVIHLFLRFENECVADTDNCAESASCTDALDGFECDCLPGFAGDGVTCVDVDECTTAPCGEHESCVNVPGDYQCLCMEGYAAGAEGCADVDECAEIPAPCDENADCENLPGTFECSCREGFIGDGTACEVVTMDGGIHVDGGMRSDASRVNDAGTTSPDDGGSAVSPPDGGESAWNGDGGRQDPRAPANDPEAPACQHTATTTKPATGPVFLALLFAFGLRRKRQGASELWADV